ncbi:hypothetical protein CQA01_42690 [Cyclobacterium qasimii]|uniref:Uncharacterized protein n=3 Tax=Cyclobacterium qasimii TaxID=1350429 RepID=A0A512CHS4_9BACT|nr:hypothetical protein CQA01_42690 [Cyclobacterium qasimii]
MGSEMMKGFGLSAKHLDCGMESHEEIPSSEKGSKAVSNQCCQNLFELIQLEVDPKLSIANADAPQMVFIAAFTHAFLLGQALVLSPVTSFSFDPPPIHSQDYTVLYQTFLI